MATPSPSALPRTYPCTTAPPTPRASSSTFAAPPIYHTRRTPRAQPAFFNARSAGVGRYQLATMYAQGEGVDQDRPRARHLFQAPAPAPHGERPRDGCREVGGRGGPDAAGERPPGQPKRGTWPPLGERSARAHACRGWVAPTADGGMGRWCGGGGGRRGSRTGTGRVLSRRRRAGVAVEGRCGT